jgi:hypothetical protein
MEHTLPEAFNGPIADIEDSTQSVPEIGEYLRIMGPFGLSSSQSFVTVREAVG